MLASLPSLEFSHHSDLKSHLETISAEIRNLMKCSHAFEQKIPVNEDPQLKDDIDIITNSYKTMEGLIQEFNVKLEQTTLLEESFCDRFRHDMRSEIGTVAGYSDLILDSVPSVYQNLTRPLVENIGVRCVALLPLIEKIEPSTQKSSEQEDRVVSRPSDQTSTILIIDDLSEKRELFSRRLVQAGHRVLLAENGQKGLDTVSAENVDLILLDILMPEMAGEVVLKIIKNDVRTSNIPVLIISSMGDTDRLAACITAGADDYIPFSVNPILFRARIQACLEKKKLRDRERQQIVELEHTRHLLHTAIQSMGDGFVVFNAQDEMVLYNQKFADIYKYIPSPSMPKVTYEDLLAINLAKKIYEFDEKKYPYAQKFAQQENPQKWLINRLQAHQKPESSYLELLSNGDWIEVTENLIPGGGVVAFHKIVTRDIIKSNRISYLADHDSLTKLLNRRAFEKALRENQTQYEETQKPFALLYLDLDKFKSVNDTYGHGIGDLLLQTIAHRLKNAFRSIDIVARLGGDEFSVILPNIACETHLKVVIERVIEALGDTFVDGDISLKFGISIGAALFPQDGPTLLDLRKKADQAMYQTKRSQNSYYCLASAL